MSIGNVLAATVTASSGKQLAPPVVASKSIVLPARVAIAANQTLTPTPVH